MIGERFGASVVVMTRLVLLTTKTVALISKVDDCVGGGVVPLWIEVSCVVVGMVSVVWCVRVHLGRVVDAAFAYPDIVQMQGGGVGHEMMEHLGAGPVTLTILTMVVGTMSVV